MPRELVQPRREKCADELPQSEVTAQSGGWSGRRMTCVGVADGEKSEEGYERYVPAE